MTDVERKPYWRSIFYKPEYRAIFNAIISLSKMQNSLTVSNIWEEVDLNYSQVARRIRMLNMSGILKKTSRGYYELDGNIELFLEETKSE